MTKKQIEFQEMTEETVITLRTNCPEKYMLIDRETGNIFIARETGEWELVRGGPQRNG